MSDHRIGPDGSKPQFNRPWFSAVTTSFRPKDLLSGLIVFLSALPLVQVPIVANRSQIQDSIRTPNGSRWAIGLNPTAEYSSPASLP